MAKKYTIYHGNRNINKDFENWLKVIKHFREKKINYLSIKPLDEALKEHQLLEL